MRSEKNPIILVANKADMVRNRKVKSSLGKELATENNIKYIETSSGKFSTFEIVKRILFPKVYSQYKNTKTRI